MLSFDNRLCEQLESRFRLREHVALVHEKKSLNVKCTECSLVFVRKRQMVDHRNLEHFTDRFGLFLWSTLEGGRSQNMGT